MKQKIRFNYGDYKVIAMMTGYAPETVWLQLNGKRTLKPKVKKAAELLLEARRKAMEEYEKIFGQENSRKQEKTER